MEEMATDFPGAEFQAVLDASLDATFVLDPDGRILNANRAAARCYGYSQEELRQINVAELAAPEIRGEVPGKLNDLLASTAIFESSHQRRDGARLSVEVHAQPLTLQGRRIILASVRDITERQQSRLALQEKEHFLQRILDTEPGTVYIHDLAEGRNVYVNRHFSTAFGYSPEQTEAIGSDVINLFHPDDRPAIVAHHRAWRVADDNETRDLEYRMRDADGAWRWLNSRETPFARDQAGRVSQVLGIAKDVTARKQAEIWLRRRNHILEMMVAGTDLSLILTTLVRAIESQSPGMLGSVLLLDDDGVHVRHGAAPSLPAEFVAAVDGQPIGPAAGSCGTAAFRREAVYVEDLRVDPLWDSYRAVAMRFGLVAAWSHPILDRGGRVLGTFAMYYRKPALPGPEHAQLMESVLHLASIAISRQREEVALREKDERLVKAQQVAHIGFIEWNLKTDAIYCSDEAYRIYGLVRETEFMGPDMIARVVHPDDLELVRSGLERAILGLGKFDLIHRIARPDGGVIWVHAQAELVRDEGKGADVLLGTMVDITRRKQAEEALQRMTRLYAALSQCNQAIVRCSSEAELYPQICRDVVEFGGMRMAWIGMIDESTGVMRPVASSGEQGDYLDAFEMPLRGDDSRSHGPLGSSLRENRPYWCQDFQHDPSTAPWRDSAARHGWHAMASLPLNQKGLPVGALVVYSEVCDAFDKPAQDLLIEMAMDISFALDRFASEADRKLSEEKLRMSELRLRTIIETEPECVKVVNRDGRLLDMNAAGLAMLEVDSIEEARRRSLHSFLLPEHREPFMALHGRVMKGESAILEFEIVGCKGTRRWLETHAAPMRDAQGEIVSLLGISRDITERKYSEERIQYLANFDALTGLPNRNLLADHLQYAISLVKRTNGNLAVIFIDLDRFKDINDTLGHSVGDAFLIEVGARLKRVLRESDTASRLGGDEFILILPDTDAQGAATIVEKLLEAISQPYQVEQYALIVTASIGIAIYPHDGENLETLSRSADTAMYRAKADGRNSYRFFTAEMQARASRHMQLVNALHRALEQDQLQLYYQPQYSICDGEIVGLEALLRWDHPELGEIFPAEFIPVAEDCGLILPIGEWVIRTAVTQLKHWLDRGFPPMVMAVNLSAVQFRHRSLPDLISGILDEASLPAELLELELTESVAMHDPEGAIAVMNALHGRGIRMSIDDFGTGYSSLNYLKKFRVYKLKIDKSFIQDIGADSEDRAIVAAITSMSRSLGLRTIAEGVETAEQLEFLREQGCNEAQGYYFSRPMPAMEIEAFLAIRTANAGSGGNGHVDRGAGSENPMTI
ncbi:EAL domain-containing protein [Rhodanobacter ginsengisoli]|uniref:EAL domain-containing protein n=1 Tax=Rhodanobacter ginsengisoli TaxID=418646 RepID=A0ABW0QN09_9GAMM